MGAILAALDARADVVTLVAALVLLAVIGWRLSEMTTPRGQAGRITDTGRTGVLMNNSGPEKIANATPLRKTRSGGRDA